MKLTEIAIKRPAFMTMIFVGLAVIGLYSYLKMGVDLLPKMDFPMVLVNIIYPGAGPKEVESQVAKPVEEILASVNGMKALRTFSNENVAFVLCEFTMSTNADVALNDVERKINSIKGQLPKEILQPQVFKSDMNDLPIIRLAITANMQPIQLFQFIKDKIKPRIEQVEGVSIVNIVGGKEREIRVEVDNDKLRANNLSISQVTQVIGSENIDFPTGKVLEEKRDFTVRLEGKYKDIETIKNTILYSSPQGNVMVKDVANVIDTYKENYTMSRLNGTSGIGMIIQKASDANAVKTSERINETIKKLTEEFKENNLKFTISVDVTQFTKDSRNDVLKDLGIAILMVALVLFFFLHNIKNAFIVILSIPTSLLSAIIMMYVFGFTVNLITLMALTLVIGILVDDSIVVLENIHRHLQMGEDPKTAAINGRSEIGLAAIAITLVDVVVFLPIAMLTGIVGMIFREFGLTVVVATLFSLFVSFTLTPLLASRWSKVVDYSNESLMGRFILKFNEYEQKIINKYRILLAWALGHRKTVVIVSILLFVSSLTFIPLGLIGNEFMPEIDRGEFALNLEMPQGTNIIENDKATKKIEQLVMSTGEVERCYTVVGRNEGAWGDINRANNSQLQIKLYPKKKRRPTQIVINNYLAMAHSVPGIKATAQLIGLFGTTDETPIWIEVKGVELEKIIPVSEEVQKIVEKTRGARDVKSSWEEGQPEVKVVVDRIKCATYNLSLGEVAYSLRNAFEGDNQSKFKEGDTEYDLRVMMSRKNRDNPDDVANTNIMNRFGQMVKLSDVAHIYFGKGPSQIQRKDRSRVISILANLDNTRPLSEVTQEIESKFNKINKPVGVTIKLSGQAEDMGTMFTDMLIAIAFAVLFVYMIMVSLFESFSLPFIIMFSLPVALFGAMMGLFFSNLNMNMFSMIGVLLSMGLVTKNGILLVDYTNTLRSRGLSVKDALIEAGATRLRPIVMTTLTMVFGMMPLLLARGGAGDMRSGIAAVVIGALISSTLLTLALVPVVYSLVDSWKERIPAFLRKVLFLGEKKPKIEPSYTRSIADETI
ncbi:MAG: hypothetical protein HW421_324 [Ignavibacteria bacterium]|nr:hypothetical protein [Ignavibacteria bacterium]